MLVWKVLSFMNLLRWYSFYIRISLLSLISGLKLSSSDQRCLDVKLAAVKNLRTSRLNIS